MGVEVFCSTTVSVCYGAELAYPGSGMAWPCPLLLHLQACVSSKGVVQNWAGQCHPACQFEHKPGRDRSEGSELTAHFQLDLRSELIHLNLPVAFARSAHGIVLKAPA